MNEEQSNIRKPKFPFWILRFIADEFHNLSAIGDLEELYSDKVIQQGWFMASLWLWRQVLRSVPHFFIHSLILSLAMKILWVKQLKLRRTIREQFVGETYLNPTTGITKLQVS